MSKHDFKEIKFNTKLKQITLNNNTLLVNINQTIFSKLSCKNQYICPLNYIIKRPTEYTFISS